MAVLFVFVMILGTMSGCIVVKNDPDSACLLSAEEVITSQCSGCHKGDSSALSKGGLVLESRADIQCRSERIRQRVLIEQSMPPEWSLPVCQHRAIEKMLNEVVQEPCMATCNGRSCGDDCCGGSCGECAEGEQCVDSNGSCRAIICHPDCSGKICGYDGCGGSCGSCPTVTQPLNYSTCHNGKCNCTPDCLQKVCGDDGCGGSCGECLSIGEGQPRVCTNGQCVCSPTCNNKLCGDDGCGGSCGSCPSSGTPSNFTTCTSGQCFCTPFCAIDSCGDDGCGGSCSGSCIGGQTCNTVTGLCALTCQPACVLLSPHRNCGNDGCGGSCGSCPSIGIPAHFTTCDNAAGQCICTPNCNGKTCGDDGCGGSCGSCPGLGDAVNKSICDLTNSCVCVASCTGKICGDDGCGGSCGSCPSSNGLNNATACDLNSGTCFCAPQCDNRSCGDDGCGGSCGECGLQKTCDGGLCVWQTVMFSQVYPVFQSSGCADSQCHSRVKPSKGLDLSSLITAYQHLVNAPSQQCNGAVLVVPANLGASYLFNKLQGQGMCAGNAMPKPPDLPLSPAEMALVEAWIATGSAP